MIQNLRSLGMRLRVRVIILSLIALIGILLVIVSSSMVWLLLAHREIVMESEQAAREFDLFMVEIRSDLTGVGDALAVIDDQNHILRDLLARHPAIFEVSVIDPDGQTILQRRRVGLHGLIQYDQQPWLEAVQAGNIYWSEVNTDEFGVPFIDIAVPIHKHNIPLEYQGTLLARLDLTAFWNEVITMRVGETGYAYLTDHAGHILVYRDIGLVRSAPMLQDEIGYTPQETVQRSERVLTSIRRGLGGQMVISSSISLVSVPWVATVEQPVDEALKTFYVMLPIFLIVLVVGLWLVLDIMRFSRRRIVNPLLHLRESVEEFGRGNLTYRVRVATRRGDEMDLLANTFNQMVEDIQRRTQELVKATATANENARLKSEFLSTVSHELRTPLNAIIGYVGIILEGLSGTIDDDARDMLERVESNSNRLLSMINDILDVAKIEAGQYEITNQAFSPSALADDWQNQMRVLAEQRHIDFQILIDPSLPDHFWGDPKRITQIITNLLSNAFKFTAQGGVRLELLWKQEMWYISVKDSGIGIPKEAIAFIFDPFRQVDGTTERQFGGTGLGLTIVHNLVTLMNGSVTVQSEVGVGSTFTVILPLPLENPNPEPTLILVR